MIHESYLLAGLPIPAGNFLVPPKTLRELVIFEEKENLAMTFFLSSAKDFGLEDGALVELSQLTLLSAIAFYNSAIGVQLCEALEYVLDQKCKFEEGLFLINNIPLSESDWEEIKNIFFAQRLTSEKELKRQNGKEELKPANEEARAAMERFREIHQEIASLKAKAKPSGDSHLMKLINVFCAKSPNTNILQVWDLTYYQFRKQFDAIIKVEQYDNTFSQIMAGADPKKMKIVHWTE